MTASSSRPLYHPRYWPTWIGLGIVRLVSLLPMRVLWCIGTALGSFFSLLPSRLKHDARVNISLCFPNRSSREQQRIVNRHFRALGLIVFCMGLSWWASPERLRRIVKIVDQQYFDRARAEGKRIILFAPHFLGLDIGGFRLGSEWEMITMYRASRDPVLELMLKRRRRFGGYVFERKDNLRSLIRRMREGHPFYYLPDQDPGGADSVFVPFFGVPAATVTAFSRIAAMTDAVVIPCYNRILPWGRGFELRFGPPLEGFPSDDPVRDARRMNEEIEKAVLQHPEQYLWVYRRFKTRPAGSPPVY